MNDQVAGCRLYRRVSGIAFGYCTPMPSQRLRNLAAAGIVNTDKYSFLHIPIPICEAVLPARSGNSGLEGILTSFIPQKVSFCC